ncbi:molybdate ABC transporter substrate-binding protein [Limnohabitans sp.]|uniref:molybdate ABC transporter substrate-binding protein n=1 Tax=Limnohabitans sp. TaxID=1907725 RepID=UPI00333E6BEE
MKLRLMLALASAHFFVVAYAGEVTVAVAANFTAPMQKIAQAFEQDTGHKAHLAFGSTGKFYAQIKNGAPFAALLAADDKTPERLEKEGLAVIGTRFTYATGRLALWSKSSNLVDDKGEVLRSPNLDKLGIQKIAMADPKIAPYGAAAMEVIHKMGVQANVVPKLVQGESIGQTYQFVSTENAQLGFVALSQISLSGRITQGSAWVVPQSMHTPLKQDAVLLNVGKDNAAALALLKYLQGDKAKTIIRQYGYAL